MVHLVVVDRILVNLIPKPRKYATMDGQSKGSARRFRTILMVSEPLESAY